MERPPLEKSFDADTKRLLGNGEFFIKSEIKEEREFGRPPPMEVLLPQYPLPRSRIQSLSPRSLDTPSDRRCNSLPDDDPEREQEEVLQKLSGGSSEDGSFQDEPENLSNGKREAEEEDEGRESLLDKFQREVGLHHFPPHILRPPSQQESGNNIPPADVTKDPNIYNVLLPRPGSTDNSWESLIEVDKSNESPNLSLSLMASTPR